MGTAFSILLLLVLCGFIAYIGDLLGRRLGKKRLSIFGLRPKHTAILLTIVTGVLIATVTFAAAMATVPGFSEVVTRGERLVRENKGLETQIRQRKHDAELLEARSSELQAQNTTLAGSNTQLSSANQKLTQQNEQLSGKNQELEKTSAQLEQANSELVNTNGGLATANRRLQSANRSLETQRKSLDGQVQQLRLLQRRYVNDPYIFERSQQIFANPIPPKPPVAIVRSAVDNALYQATRLARVKSQLAVDSEALNLVAPPDYPPGRPTTRQSLLLWVVTQAHAAADRPLVVRVRAAENCVKGRVVPVWIEIQPNDLVFKRGELIAWSRIDCDEGEGAILGGLFAFVTRTMPAKVTAEPYSMAPAGDSLGEIGYDRIADTFKQLTQMKGPVWIRARARQDTYRAGPLNVDLEVKPVDTAAAGWRQDGE